MIPARLDHLVVGAAALDTGAAALERHAGVTLPPGGAHPLMGTHNRLARLGDDGAFIELLAIDPDAVPPAHPRWFDLDGAATRRRLALGPTLLTWVVGVDDLDAALARVRAAGVDAGRAVEQRRDDLRWRIAVRGDGALVEGGVFPALIEWPPGTDPTARMADVGLALAALRATYPEPDRIAAALAAIGAERFLELGPGEAALSATLARGDRRIAL